MQITRFNHVGLNAAGLHAETKSFYEDFLGLNDFERTGAAKLVNGFWSGADVPIIHVISDVPAESLEMPSNTHVSLFVRNIDQAVDEVKASCDPVLHVGEGDTQIIWFKDPAGNTLEFQQDPDVAYVPSEAN